MRILVPPLRRLAVLVVCFYWLTPATAETLIVGNKSAASASLIDLATGHTVATIPTGEGPHEVATSADGRLAVVTNYGVRARPGNSLSVIDVADARELRRIDLGRYTRPHGIQFLPDGERVLVTAEGADALLIVNVTRGMVEKVLPTEQKVSHMVVANPDRALAWVSNMGSASVTLIDLTGQAPPRYVHSGKDAEGIALSADGLELWVTNRGEDTLSLFNAEELTLEKTLAAPGFPIRAEFMPAGDRLLVTGASGGELAVIDTVSREVERVVSLGLAAADSGATVLGELKQGSSIPIGIEIAPAGDRVWIAHAAIDRVQELDPTDWKQRRLLKTGREPDAMAYSVRRVAVEHWPAELRPAGE